MTVQEWLGEDNQLGIDIWEKKYRYGNETLDEWVYRVSGGSPEVAQLILEKKFLFGGRILAHRGVPQNVQRTTYSNCYVLTVQDSLESIYSCCAEMARTYSLGGGVGIDISNLRPRGALVHNSAKETTGAVSFMKTFETVTSTIGQNGRRGKPKCAVKPCELTHVRCEIYSC
jgi:ribonucleoside-diphosphate reductase alpha chain